MMLGLAAAEGTLSALLGYLFFQVGVYVLQIVVSVT